MFCRAVFVFSFSLFDVKKEKMGSDWNKSVIFVLL